MYEGTFNTFEGLYEAERAYNYFVKDPDDTDIGIDFSGCFAGYYSRYISGSSWEYSDSELIKKLDKNRQKNFYFFFSSCPEWMPEIIEELNKEFKNIKFEMLRNEYLYINHITERYRNWEGNFKSYSTNRLEASPQEKSIKVSCPLFHVKLNDDYSKFSHLILGYLTHHLLRMFSLGENYLSYGEPNPNYNVLDFICNINNSEVDDENAYRSLSERYISKDELLKMDDIELANSVFENSTYRTQTEALDLLNDRYDPDFSYGD